MNASYNTYRKFRFISNRQGEMKINAIINNTPIEILPDFRGEFNVITRTALKLVEEKNGKLKRIYDSKNIPLYLKNEGMIKFEAAEINIEVKLEKTIEEAIIIQHDESYVIVGRHVCKSLDSKI